jgi:hypothetical protein
MRNLFDESEAKAEADALVAARIAAGWNEPATVIAARVEAERASDVLEIRLHALAELAGTDPIGALKAFTEGLFEGPSFQRLLEHVEVVDEIGARGFVIRFRDGATAVWAATPEHWLARLWLYLDPSAATRNEHHLFYGDGAGPPEGDAELDGTTFEATEVVSAGVAVGPLLVCRRWRRALLRVRRRPARRRSQREDPRSRSGANVVAA